MCQAVRPDGHTCELQARTRDGLCLSCAMVGRTAYGIIKLQPQPPTPAAPRARGGGRPPPRGVYQASC